MKFLTREKLRGTFAGFLIAIASWMMVIPLREKIIEFSPIKNTFILAGILFLIAWWLLSLK